MPHIICVIDNDLWYVKIELSENDDLLFGIIKAVSYINYNAFYAYRNAIMNFAAIVFVEY